MMMRLAYRVMPACLTAALTVVFLFGVSTAAPQTGTAVPSKMEAEKLFQQTILPLLKRKCITCHGDDPKKVHGELDLRTRAGMLKGGQSGIPALVPGDPANSPLFVAVTRKDESLVMPPKENDKLSADEVEAIRRWVAAGAPWSDVPAPTSATAKWDATSADGIAIVTSGGRSPEWTNRKYRPEDVWAYQPVRRPPIPFTGDGQHPIDAFL